jgi:hypothetical protein
MPILHVMAVIIVIGVLLWLVDSFIPMQAQVKQILNYAVVIILVLWLLSLLLGYDVGSLYLGPRR